MPLTEELKALAARVSNWGRWGADDERGTLNLVDEAAVRRGAAAVRAGKSFSLSIPMDAEGPQTGRVLGRENPAHSVTLRTFPFTGDDADAQWSDDKIDTGLQSATHWDALGHAGYEHLLYNGIAASTITDDHGATRAGIEQFGPLVTRGLLCDVAKLKGVEWFDEPYSITGDDLEACVSGAGLYAEPGDVVLVRTNQMHWLREGERERYADISPGVGVESLDWLHDHDIAAVATDTHTFEPYPGEWVENPFLFPVHMISLRDMGMPQGQQWALDELAADCAADGIYEFLLVATPLPVTGGLGGLVAPTAAK